MAGYSDYPINPFRSQGPNFGLLDTSGGRGQDSSKTSVVQLPNVASQNEEGLLRGIASMNDSMKTGAEIQNQKAEMALKQQEMENEKAMAPLNMAEKQSEIAEHQMGALNLQQQAALNKTKAQEAQDTYNDQQQATKKSGGNMDKYVNSLAPKDRMDALKNQSDIYKNVSAGKESIAKMNSDEVKTTLDTLHQLAGIGMAYNQETDPTKKAGMYQYNYPTIKKYAPNAPTPQEVQQDPSKANLVFAPAINTASQVMAATRCNPYLQKSLVSPDKQSEVIQDLQSGKSTEATANATSLATAQTKLNNLKQLIQSSGGYSMASPELQQQYDQQQTEVQALSAQVYKGTTPVMQNLQAAGVSGGQSNASTLTLAASGESETPTQKGVTATDLAAIKADKLVAPAINRVNGDTAAIQDKASSMPEPIGPLGVGKATAWMATNGQELNKLTNGLVVDTMGTYSGSKSAFRSALMIHVFLGSKPAVDTFMPAFQFNNRKIGNANFASQIEAWSKENNFESSQVQQGLLPPEQYKTWLQQNPNPINQRNSKYFDVEGVNKELPKNLQISDRTAAELKLQIKNPYDTPQAAAGMEQAEKYFNKVKASVQPGFTLMVDPQGNLTQVRSDKVSAAEQARYQQVQ